MMKKYLLFVGFVTILAYVNCGKEPTVLIDQTQHLEQGSFWFDEFVVDSGVELDVDFEVILGSAVDVLLMNWTGFSQFRAIFHITTLESGSGSIGGMDTQDFYFYVDYGHKITVAFSSNEPANIYLRHQDGTEIISFIETTDEVFEYITVQSETLNLQIYNPSYLQGLNYDLLVTKQQSSTPFTYYYTAGSALNVTSSSYSFETPIHAYYYIVVNNGGNVQGGATPHGDVDFHIVVTTP